MIGLIKQLKICLQSVAKKQDVFGIFTDWRRQEFDLPLPDAKNFKCSTVVIVMPKGGGGGGMILNVIALIDIPSQSSGIISIKLPC